MFLDTEKRFIFQAKEFGYIQRIYHKSIDLKAQIETSTAAVDPRHLKVEVAE